MVPAFVFFFFNDTATTEIYTLSLHDALPICLGAARCGRRRLLPVQPGRRWLVCHRSEEHTSELQSPCNLVCRLLLEKKKTSHQVLSVYCSATIRPSATALLSRRVDPSRFDHD